MVGCGCVRLGIIVVSALQRIRLWQVRLIGYRLESLGDKGLCFSCKEVLKLFCEHGLELCFRTFVLEKGEHIVG